MLEIKKKIASKLSSLAEGALSVDEIAQMLEYPPDSTMGDLALPCFKFAKMMRKSPMMIASAFAEGFSCEGVKEARALGGYLNFVLDESFYAGVVNTIVREGGNYGRSNEGEGKTVVLDYSSPNLAKPFHIGHLGTTVIGHALKNLHEFVGYQCVGINYVGDWGTQFGKLIVAYKKWGNKEQVENGGVDALVDLYVRINNAISGNKEQGIPADPALADEARAEFRKMELGDEENLALWRWLVNLSLNANDEIYKMLGITFDSYRGESFYTDKMPEQIEKMRDMGLLKIDDGASIVNLEAYNMPPCLILKRDGSTLYPTRDIAAAVYRKKTYDFDKCIYVTSSGQSLHFAQWFKVVDLMGYDWADKLVHVPYGTISIGGAKLATRTGNVILLRDLFATAIEKCLDVINEKNPSLIDKEATAEAVGVGAIVFYYLLNGRIKDSDFNMDDALSFDGNTGPYTQYTYARCSSILEKTGEPIGEVTAYTHPSEQALAKVLSRFPEAVRAALREYEPSVVTRYSLEVATAFNKFYQDCRIIAADGTVDHGRVQLVKATRSVIREALALICLKTPEKI